MSYTRKKLANIAAKNSKTVIGLMSGTSLDGLDIAHCNILGGGEETKIKLIDFHTVPYSNELKQMLQLVVSVEKANLQNICLLNSYLGDYFGEKVLELMNEWDLSAGDVDCIASHGQTIYHAPLSHHRKPKFQNTTFQIGDADHIAQKTGIITISDFRQKHTATGGEGAPMAALVDERLFRDVDEFRLLLNIGGIANFTYLPPGRTDGKVITTDTGPGNTLIDGIARKFLGQAYDKNGQTAAQGEVNSTLLAELKDNDFFELSLPKTTGPELFNEHYLEQTQNKTDTKHLSPKDLLATLSRFTVETIAESIKEVHKYAASLQIYMSGGGMHNTFMVNSLQKQMENVNLHSFADIGFNPDAKEAVCFAVLANEMLSGEGFYFNPNKKEKRVNFGKISLPD